MAETPPPAPTHLPKGPNFGMVVFLSGVVMIVLLIAAYFLLRGDARKLMLKPKTHPTALILR